MDFEVPADRARCPASNSPTAAGRYGVQLSVPTDKRLSCSQEDVFHWKEESSSKTMPVFRSVSVGDILAEGMVL